MEKSIVSTECVLYTLFLLSHLPTIVGSLFKSRSSRSSPLQSYGRQASRTSLTIQRNQVGQCSIPVLGLLAEEKNIETVADTDRLNAQHSTLNEILVPSYLYLVCFAGRSSLRIQMSFSKVPLFHSGWEITSTMVRSSPSPSYEEKILLW